MAYITNVLLWSSPQGWEEPRRREAQAAAGFTTLKPRNEKHRDNIIPRAESCLFKRRYSKGKDF